MQFAHAYQKFLLSPLGLLLAQSYSEASCKAGSRGAASAPPMGKKEAYFDAAASHTYGQLSFMALPHGIVYPVAVASLIAVPLHMLAPSQRSSHE